VAVVAPHTSFWDFPILISLALKHRVKANWLGKHTLFRGPFRWFFRWLGGIPVDPANGREGRVAGVVRMFRENEKLRIGIAPEAGLSPVTRWRSGFYHIAHAAGVPLLLVYADYGRKVAGADTWFTPTGDIPADYQRLRDFYREITPRHPEKFALPEV
jgi:1-acyl-sn-glycerol-3-phosphate acyltransferase